MARSPGSVRPVLCLCGYHMHHICMGPCVWTTAAQAGMLRLTQRSLHLDCGKIVCDSFTKTEGYHCDSCIVSGSIER